MSKNLIKIYLINLDRSPERLDFMLKQLIAINLNFERIVAIDGVTLEKNLLGKYQQQSATSFLHYSTLSYGEIGCAMSWHKTWSLIADNNNKACIALEDDVKLKNNFLITIQALFANLNPNIIIDLSGKKGFNIIEKKQINGITLLRYQTPPLRNQGAIYGKNAIKIFQHKIQNFKAPVDTLQQMLWIHGVQTWSLEKGCIAHQDFLVGGSTINMRKKNFIQKLKKELSRPLWRGYIIIKNLLLTK